ncbi:hypothetical protein CsSME_00048865 [Camellia sinensis var. sinensis]
MLFFALISMRSFRLFHLMNLVGRRLHLSESS